MIECHGWITIREAYNEKGESDERLGQALTIVSSAVEEIQNTNLLATVITQNGCHNVIVNGNFNHADSRWRDVVGLFQQVADVAEGSYGLLHFHDDEAGQMSTRDDEAQNGKGNVFQLYILKRGKIELSVEEKLSPYFPTLEDYSE